MPQGKLLPRTWILLLAGVVLIRLTILRPDWVEQYYSSFLYYKISFLQRSLTGFIPFSVGDILYIAAGIWLLRELVVIIRSLSQNGFSWSILQKFISGLILCFLWIYLIFNVLWGLNYNRLSVLERFSLAVHPKEKEDLLPEITALLLARANAFRPSGLSTPEHAMQLARTAYARAGTRYPFLNLQSHSIKPSLFGTIGSYMGYSGYYNPFTGEAQVNTAVPGFLLPFVSCHEMAHQAGYAKENEANLCGFLAARESTDSAMLYSAYISMFLYANARLGYTDSTAAAGNLEKLRPEVRRDLRQYKAYLAAHQSFLGDAVDSFYNQFLKLNEQPAGSRTYGLVVEGLLAYYRKYGDL